MVVNFTKGLIQEHNDKQSYDLRVIVNLFVLKVLENCYGIVSVATHHMIKFAIIIGRKYFSNNVTQSNYLIIKTKLLTALFKNNIETKEYSKFVET